ncbi:MAG: cbb3-type cytochrome c oxidase N-terminal domain-containing protein [Panacibacter sp.]
MKPTGHKQWLRTTALTGVFAFFAIAKVFAEGPPKPSQLENPLAVSLLVVAGALLLAIVMLGRVLINVAELRIEREIEEGKIPAAPVKTLLVLAFCTISSMSFAQDAAAPAQNAVTTIGGLSEFVFYTIIGVIVLEILVITAMLVSLKGLIAKEKIPVVAVEEKQKNAAASWKKLWIRMNNFRPAHEEVDLGHDYDGIRELDNRLPPWWIYGFYLCIIFAGIYLYRNHISHTAPSSEQEYLAAVAKADVDKEAYLKKAANKVDENSVVLLTDAGALTEGKKIFNSTCAPCHGLEGQGVVGPNLTDDYWLHKGGIKDVFKIIKYGVPEKGMKSWEADFNPVQIAELASYIKSIHGTKPTNPKDPQGDLYNEQETTSDSAKVVTTVQAEK